MDSPGRNTTGGKTGRRAHPAKQQAAVRCPQLCTPALLIFSTYQHCNTHKLSTAVERLGEIQRPAAVWRCDAGISSGGNYMAVSY
ncbi:hypothetical protein ARTHRO9AX_10244 [Arthrobacter sp. 9AX]|nr:hypothetical protein ARTHRO9AX_10244 [Arthrobacter sp. 9AX]